MERGFKEFEVFVQSAKEVLYLAAICTVRRMEDSAAGFTMPPTDAVETSTLTRGY